jgi:hypothetical protein
MPDEEYDAVDSNDPAADATLVDPDVESNEDVDAYSGPPGGSVGGTPANKRATGGTA